MSNPIKWTMFFPLGVDPTDVDWDEPARTSGPVSAPGRENGSQGPDQQRSKEF